MVFWQKLRAVCDQIKREKITLLALNVQTKNVLKRDRNRV